MTDNRPIAFFDSGVGGVTVLQKVKQLLKNENFMYYGDTKHLPYGEKTKTQLLEYAHEIFKFFEEKDIKALVLACNTTSSVIYDEVKDSYRFKIYPIIQNSAKVIAKEKISKIGVFATKATVKTGAYERELRKYNKNLEVFSMYCPQWVKIVEDNSKNLPKNIETVKKDLEKMLLNKPQKIILGCTHYPYLKDILSKFADENMFIDPAICFAEYIAEDLRENGLLCDKNNVGHEKFYVSKNPEKFYIAAKGFYPELKNFPNLV